MAIKSRAELTGKVDTTLKLIEREKAQVLIYGKFLQNLKNTANKQDINQTKYFSNRLARAERRIHAFKKSLLKSIDVLRKDVTPWNKPLKEIEDDLNLYESKLVAEDSLGFFRPKGKIPNLLKKVPVNWEELKEEIDIIYERGVSPLIAVLDSLKNKLEKLKSEVPGLYSLLTGPGGFDIERWEKMEKALAKEKGSSEESGEERIGW